MFNALTSALFADFVLVSIVAATLGYARTYRWYWRRRWISAARIGDATAFKRRLKRYLRQGDRAALLAALPMMLAGVVEILSKVEDLRNPSLDSDREVRDSCVRILQGSWLPRLLVTRWEFGQDAGAARSLADPDHVLDLLLRRELVKNYGLEEALRLLQDPSDLMDLRRLRFACSSGLASDVLGFLVTTGEPETKDAATEEIDRIRRSGRLKLVA